MAPPRTLPLSLAVLSTFGAALVAQEPDQPPQKPVPPAAEAPPVLPTDQEAERAGAPVRELTVEDAMRLSRRYNVELRAAELLPEQSRQDLQQALAFFEPELYAEAGYARNKTPTLNVFQPSIDREIMDAALGWRHRLSTGGMFDLAYRPRRVRTSSSLSGAFPAEQWISEFSVTYTQPLLRGAWTDYGLRDVTRARYGLARTRHDFEQTVQDTLLATVTAYWDLVFARENYRVVLEALQVAREQLRITDERIRVRELAPRDRVADEAEVARRQEELIVAENDIRTAEDALRRLIFDDQRGGIWHTNLRPISTYEIEVQDHSTPYEEYAEVALANRADIKALRNSVAEAEIDLMVAERDLLPGLDLVADYSTDGVAESALPDAFLDSAHQEFPDWSLRLLLSVPLGNHAAKAARTRAALEVERRKRVLYGAMMDVSSEVRDAVRNLRTLAQSIAASAESVRLAETNLETERVKLRVGATTAFEVQRRNQELAEARSRHLRNLLDYRVALVRLDYVQGILVVPE